MASTSVTTAATEPRTTSDDDERGMLFLFGRVALTLVKFGLDEVGVGGRDAASPDRARAHAAGYR